MAQAAPVGRRKASPASHHGSIAIRALWVWLGLVVAVHGSARAQAGDTQLWCFSPGDHVLAIGKLGHTLYLGGSFLYVGPSTGGGVPCHAHTAAHGSFLYVGPSTGGGVPCDAHTAAPLPSYPRVVGRVYTVVADGQGGWYIGGLFSYVGGQARGEPAQEP